MDNTLTYTNHKGDVLRFGPNEILHYQEHDLRDFRWEIRERNGRIASFSRGTVVDKKLPIVIAAPTEAQGVAMRNYIYDVFERDIDANVAGAFAIGNYQLRAFVIGSQKSEYHFSDKVMESELTVITDNPAWVREQHFRFLPESAVTGYKYLDFPIGFPFDLSPNRASRSLENESRTPSDFILTIYGPAINPYVLIAGNRYQISCSLGDGDFLVINSRDKTSLVRTVDGTVSNVFAQRTKGRLGSGSYLFERIKPGLSDVSWDNGFGFDLVIYDERSEPLWT